MSTELLPPRQQAALELLAPQSIGLDFYGDLLFTTETELRERPRRAQAMRAATLRGWQYAMAHQAELVDLIQTRYPGRQSREQLLFEADRMMPLMETNVVEAGYSNPERWRIIAAAYTSLGMLLNRLFDRRFPVPGARARSQFAVRDPVRGPAPAAGRGRRGMALCAPGRAAAGRAHRPARHPAAAHQRRKPVGLRARGLGRRHVAVVAPGRRADAVGALQGAARLRAG
ncbi:ABC transporter substrate-binding protein [Massilia sp. H-1]|nr:ABC transporter substrate-binding protein [Massilia sp. H-1]